MREEVCAHLLSKAALSDCSSAPTVHRTGVDLKRKGGKEDRPDVNKCQAWAGCVASAKHTS